MFFRNNDLFVNGNMQITLRKMCKIMDIKLPREFKHIADDINNDIVLMDDDVKKGSIYIILHDKVDDILEKSIKKGVAKGAVAIFVGVKEFGTCGLNSDDYPCIFMEDKINQVGSFFNTIKSYYGPKTLTITGTVGKTTTNKLLTELVKPSFNTYNSKGNLNSFMSTASHILKRLDKDTEMYIQEMGAGVPGWVRKNARMLMPDGLILLNVQPHHLNTYKTIECLFEDKTSPDDYLSSNGVIVANYDDDLLANHTFKHKVVSFGINTERKVDYRAINIVQNKEFLEFDIVSGSKKPEHIKVEILGEHNAYNILAAYVMAKQVGIKSGTLRKRLLNYRSSGIRQNFKKIGGNYVYVDCYNACESSIIATVKAMESFEVSEGCKKIGIVGGENKLGDTAAEVHYRIGTQLNEAEVSELVLFGTSLTDRESIDRYGDAYSMERGLNDHGFSKTKVVTDTEQLYDYLAPKVEYGDLLFFKGVLWLDMAIVIDKLFGTSFTYDLVYYKDRARKIKEGNFDAHILEEFGECEITGISEPRDTVVLPDTIEGYPVFRLRSRAFQHDTTLKNITFGSTIKNIGYLAFNRCSTLESVEIPGNVKVIERSAFRNCSSLEKVVIKEGVTHIGRDAFGSNPALKEVVLPKSILNIENNAFYKCSNIKLYCIKDSYAEEYAKMNDLPFEYYDGE